MARLASRQTNQKAIDDLSMLFVLHKLLRVINVQQNHPRLVSDCPIEQEGFRPGGICVNQVMLLNTHMEAGFQNAKRQLDLLTSCQHMILIIQKYQKR